MQILKSDPQTFDEAKQKTKALTILAGIVMGVVSIVFCILSILLGLLVAVGSAICVFCLYVSWSKQNKRNFCSECGTRFDYERCVAWEVSNLERKIIETSSNSSSQNRKAIKKEIATVHFTCTCENCGNTKEFDKKYDVTIWYDDGSRKDFNINDLAKNYFKL